MTELEIAQFIKREIEGYKIIHPEKLDEIFEQIIPRLTYAAAFSEWKDRDIQELELSNQTVATLKKAGVNTVEDLIQRAEKGVDFMYSIRNFGEKKLNEVVVALEKHNLIQYIGYV